MTKTIYVITWMTKFKNGLDPRYNSDQTHKKKIIAIDKKMSKYFK